MNHLQKFHSIAEELLRYLNFSDNLFDTEQEILSLDVDGRFVLHFELLDEDFWLMHAELGVSPRDQDGQWKEFSWRDGQINVGHWQPCIAIDEDNQLRCWLQLPLQEHDLPSSLDAFDAVVNTTEQLLEGAMHALVELPVMQGISGGMDYPYATS